tara:strand:- start:218 stop:478 length:261 start_codon:yes stop_codon:yes gene_type:complete
MNLRTKLKVNKRWLVSEINVTSEKDIINGGRKLGMVAGLTVDGKGKDAIHTLQGEEQPTGTVTIRTNASGMPDSGPKSVHNGRLKD